MINEKEIREYFESIQSKIGDERFKVAALTKLESLSGGLVNYVYRLYFESEHLTLILKYFPPYLAMDKSIAFSQQRYFVEKIALEEFGTQKWLKLNEESGVRTPKIFHCDDEKFVLIMQDAGLSAKPLFELLKLGSELTGDTIKWISKEVKFFEDFITLKANIKSDTFGKNPIGIILKSYIKNTIKEQAKLADLEKELEGFIAQHDQVFKSPEFENEKSYFTFGDFWPNSLLIDQEKRLLWFIDWEAARFERDSFRDVEQFLCNLWIMKQNSNVFDAEKIGNLIYEIEKLYFSTQSSIIDWRSDQNDLKIDRRVKFILWVLILIKEEHWKFENKKQVILSALAEIQKLN
jgi:5-methylthioribose kinase